MNHTGERIRQMAKSDPNALLGSITRNSHHNDRHAGQSDVEMMERILSKPGQGKPYTTAQSKFYEKDRMGEYIMEAIKDNADEIAEWLNDKNGRNAKEFWSKPQKDGKATGSGIRLQSYIYKNGDDTRTIRKLEHCRGYTNRMVLKKDPDPKGCGFSLVTIFPDIQNEHAQKTGKDLMPQLHSTLNYRYAYGNRKRQLDEQVMPHARKERDFLTEKPYVNLHERRFEKPRFEERQSEPGKTEAMSFA